MAFKDLRLAEFTGREGFDVRPRLRKMTGFKEEKAMLSLQASLIKAAKLERGGGRAGGGS
jgi:hypothetical protein